MNKKLIILIIIIILTITAAAGFIMFYTNKQSTKISSTTSSASNKQNGSKANSEKPAGTAPVSIEISYNDIFKSTVKFKCNDRFNPGGYYYGSGFVVPGNRIITAAHILYAASGNSCEIIFPDLKRNATYAVKTDLGDIDKITEVYTKQYKDIAVLPLPPIENNPPVAAKFGDIYPDISLPFCDSSIRIGDKVQFFGYPEDNPNYLSDSLGSIYGYLSPNFGTYEKDGEFLIDSNIALGEISSYPGSMNKYNEVAFKTEGSSLTSSREGYSGGPAIDVDKKCILGPVSGYKIYQGLLVTNATWLFEAKDVVQ